MISCRCARAIAAVAAARDTTPAPLATLSHTDRASLVQVALLLGVPLMFRRLLDLPTSQAMDVSSEGEGSTSEGTTSQAPEELKVSKTRRSCPALTVAHLWVRALATWQYETKMYVYKLMTTPGLGLPLTWNQNGAGTKLPPVLACRSDGIPFTKDDWACPHGSHSDPLPH